MVGTSPSVISRTMTSRQADFISEMVWMTFMIGIQFFGGSALRLHVAGGFRDGTVLLVVP